MNITEEKITKLEENQIFVFGSNPQGRHGLGSAKEAKDKFGAIYGQGEGLQGNAYALPTKDLRVKENDSLKSIDEKISNATKLIYKLPENSIIYEQTYLKEIKKARLWHRFISKKNLLKNWFKYSPDVRSEFLRFYQSKLFKK